MSQQDVLRVLKKHPEKEFTLEELAEKFNAKLSNVNVWVNKLDKWGLVKLRKEGGKKYIKIVQR